MTKPKDPNNHKPRGKNAQPLARIIAEAAGVNVNTIYTLSKLLNEKVLKDT